MIMHKLRRHSSMVLAMYNSYAQRCMQGSAASLELAAAEMAQAAATLVQLERDILASPLESTDVEFVVTEQARAEAAAVLERKMAAMEAVLAARRQQKSTPAPVLEATSQQVDPKMAEMAQAMLERMRPPDADRSTGPAAGNGYELMLQVRNFEKLPLRARESTMACASCAGVGWASSSTSDCPDFCRSHNDDRAVSLCRGSTGRAARPRTTRR